MNGRDPGWNPVGLHEPIWALSVIKDFQCCYLTCAANRTLTLTWNTVKPQTAAHIIVCWPISFCVHLNDLSTQQHFCSKWVCFFYCAVVISCWSSPRGCLYFHFTALGTHHFSICPNKGAVKRPKETMIAEKHLMKYVLLYFIHVHVQIHKLAVDLRDAVNDLSSSAVINKTNCLLRSRPGMFLPWTQSVYLITVVGLQGL